MRIPPTPRRRAAAPSAAYSAQATPETVSVEVDVHVVGDRLVFDLFGGVPGQESADLLIHVGSHGGVVDKRATEFVDQVFPGDHQRRGGWRINAGDVVVQDAVHLGGRLRHGIAKFIEAAIQASVFSGV